jgi:hypothetical protein
MNTLRMALSRNSGGPPTPSGSTIGRSSAFAVRNIATAQRAASAAGIA